MKKLIIITLAALSLSSTVFAETFVNASGMEESRLSAQPKASVEDVRLGIPIRPAPETAGYRFIPSTTPKAPIVDTPEVLDAIQARISGQSYVNNINTQDRPQGDQARKIAVQTDSGSYGNRSENLQFYRIREDQNYKNVPLRPAGAETGSGYRN